jgi:glycosyltransferase involved in cell wall biosynthesis
MCGKLKSINKVLGNVVLVDFVPNKEWSFIGALSKSAGLNWRPLSCDYRRKSNVRRLLMYFIFPFALFLRRKQFKNIIAWQQFYGLILAFYMRTFKVRKTFSLTVMTFIYREKSGLAGRVYKRFMRYMVENRYVDKIIVFSSGEVDYYSRLFPLAKSKFTYIPLGIEAIKGLEDREERIERRGEERRGEERFLLSTGKSNRDYDFLFKTLLHTQYHVKIIADTVKQPSCANIEVYNNVFGFDMLQYMSRCFCVVIALKDTNISSGQLVMLQAMQLGKPVIVTESEGVSDYIVHGYNGLIIKKEKQHLLNALQQLYSDAELYEKLSCNAKIEYNKKHTRLQFGMNIGNCIKKLIIK